MSVRDQEISSVKQRFDIIGHSPLLNRAIETAIKVAQTDISVLITGESGVGKEAFSKIIHGLSKRRHNHSIAINAGAIPAGTIDSELFGHEKGAFTSAHDTRKGYFETAHKGTIFLDEIGELPLETQSRLLRVLEYGEFLKVGSSKVQKTDVRVIAATNRDLLKRAQENKFREDLYYRLSAITIHIPPLRKRQEDIPLLFMKFARDFSDQYRVPPVELDAFATARLQKHSWPGNIRQLKNVVEQLSILESDRMLSAERLEEYMPLEQNTNVAKLGFNEESSSSAGLDEREILYKFLFEIKKDVSELKSIMYNLASQQAMGNSQASLSRLLPGAAPSYSTSYEDDGHTVDHEEVEERKSETLSLHDQEIEMIKRALNKHRGKRKTAAQELGISERTLYRKIKEFNLEDY